MNSDSNDDTGSKEMDSIEEFKKRFPEHRYKTVRLVKADEENEEVQVGGRSVPRIGQDVVIVESKPVSRLTWLVLGGAAAALGWFLFRKYGPAQPPQQFVIAPPAAPEVSAEDKALTELLGGD